MPPKFDPIKPPRPRLPNITQDGQVTSARQASKLGTLSEISVLIQERSLCVGGGSFWSENPRPLLVALPPSAVEVENFPRILTRGTTTSNSERSTDVVNTSTMRLGTSILFALGNIGSWWDLRIVRAPWDRNLNFKGCDAFAVIETNGNETSWKNHALRHVAWRTSKLLEKWPPVRPVPDYSPVQRSGAVTRRHYRISSPFLRQTFKAAPPKCNIPTQKTIPRNHVD